ncbi:MAG: hypothetical protein RRZ92_02845 [Bacilli bacterium]
MKKKLNNGLSDISFLTFKNKCNMELKLCTFGASIYSIKLGRKFLTYAPKNKEIFLTSLSYFGKSVGPICGRLKGGIISTDYIYKNLESVDNEEILLHSGFFGISFMNFAYEIREDLEKYEILFIKKIDDKKVNDGFFNSLITITYVFFKERNEIQIIHEITPFQDTVMSLTSHTYFVLNRSKGILNNNLFVDASHYGALNDDLLLNHKEKVDEVMDFRVAHKIGDFFSKTVPLSARGYDHPFYFDHNDINKPQVILEDKKITLEVYSDYGGAYIYTNNFFNGEHILGHGKNTAQKAIAIEPQIEPFEQDKMIIKFGSTRKNIIKYVFKEKKI